LACNGDGWRGLDFVVDRSGNIGLVFGRSGGSGAGGGGVGGGACCSELGGWDVGGLSDSVSVPTGSQR
jgi:hypothetical protein